MSEKIKTIKGFNHELKCRGMQCVKVNGEAIKPDTWYRLKNGKVQETE